MISLYLTVAIFILMVAYAGMENTIRLFAYIDLQLRYIPIRIRMELMKRKLKRQLVKDQKYFLERSKEHAESN